MDAPDEMVEAVAQVLLPWLLPPTRVSIDYPLSAARAVLSVPALAEVIARDAKVREMWPVVDRLEGHWCECPLPPDAGCSRCHDFFHARSTIAALYPEAGR